MIPYDVLDVDPDSGDEAIRKAYLKLVKKFSPDTHPERFKKINEAYTQIKDEKSRLNYYIFNQETYADTPLELLLNYFNEQGERKPPDISKMKQILKDSVGE